MLRLLHILDFPLTGLLPASDTAELLLCNCDRLQERAVNECLDSLRKATLELYQHCLYYPLETVFIERVTLSVK